jgi:type IV pilus assembly protein PilF
MQRNKIVIVFLSIFLTIGCSQKTPAPKKLSKNEQAKVYRNLGIRYYKLGKLDIAKKKLKKALEIDPAQAQTHNALGVLYGSLNHKKTARGYFESAIALAPEDAKIKNNYGRFLCEQGEFQNAMTYLQSASADLTHNAQWQVLANLGHCDLLQGNKRKAILYFKKALQQNPRHAPALLEMSKIYYEKSKFMSARAFLERFFSASGKFRNAESLNLGYRIEKALGAEKKSEQYQRSLLRQFPGSKETEAILLER